MAVEAITAVGPLPTGWHVARLKVLATHIGSGATPRGGGAIYLDERFNYAIVRSQNVFDRFFNEEGLAYISESDATALRGVELQADDVLLNITGDGITFGRSCLVPTRVLPACVNQHVVRIRCDRTKCSPGYLLSFLTHPLTKDYIESFNAGGSRRAITKGHIESFEVPLPPLAEQQAIACILGALDDKIELNRRRNRTLEAMARAIFQSWFVDFDPVRAKADGRAPVGLSKEVAALFPDSFDHSTLGPIPKGWGIRTLGELTTKIGSGATPRGGEKVYINDGIAFVRSQNVYDFEFRWEGLVRITPETAAALDGVTLEPEDILFNITGASILRTCVVDPAVLPARVNQHVARIRANPDVPSRFLHLALVRDEMKQHLIGFNAGATREAVTKGHLQSVRLVVPPQPILQRFGKATCLLYAQKDTAQQQSRTLAALRDALLPKLISGELRVQDVERTVGRTA